MLDFAEVRSALGGMGSGAPIEKYVDEKVGGRAIEELPMALGIAVTRLSDHKLAIFNRGATALADVLLHPNIGYYAGFKEEYRRRVIDTAERYTRERSGEIRAALAKRGMSPAAGH